MSHPLPGQPAPQGWVYIKHPDVGISENPVPRGSIDAWIKLGWSEVADEAANPAPAAGRPAPSTVPTTKE